MVIGIASILSLQAAGAAQPTQVEAGDLRLEFTHTDQALRGERLVDTSTQHEFVTEQPLPLFSLVTRNVGTGEEKELTAETGWEALTVERGGSITELNWLRHGDSSLDGVGARVVVGGNREQNAIQWDFSVQNDSPHWSILGVVFPEVALAEMGMDGSVFFPRAPGEVQQGLWRKQFRNTSK